MHSVYQLSDGRLWDVDGACFVEIATNDAEIVQLYADGKPAGEDYLIRTLRFYGHPLGELVDKDEDGVLEQLAELDARYLTPRVLAGLATGDAYAAGRWEAHEAEAEPLREKLAALRPATPASLSS